MKSNTTRVVVGIAVVVVAVVLLIVLKDDGKSASEEVDGASDVPAKTDQTSTGEKSQSKPAIPTIVIKNGEPVGGIAELTYSEGDQIRFKVDSDVSEEIHVHGYDLMKDVEAGGSVTFDFPATIEGVFEAELEGQGEQIAELTVNP